MAGRTWPVVLLTLLPVCWGQELLPFPPEPPMETTTVRPSGPATYWATFATQIRPDQALPVTVQLANPSASSSVTATLRNTSDSSVLASSGPVTVTGPSEITFSIQIPKDLKNFDYRRGRGRWYGFEIHLEAVGDVVFNKSHRVQLEEKAFSVFVQTDKAVYKPGQTVRIRALAMKPDLRILQEPMDIFIKDPDGNGMALWRNLTGAAEGRVVEISFPTSDQPPLGDWTIEVTVAEYTESKTFTIDEYVLPKFEAKVAIPSYMLSDDPQLKGTASAKYTFGKPLTEAGVLVTVKFRYFYSRDGSPHPVLTAEGKLDKKGEFNFAFSNEQLKELAWKTFFNYRNAQRKHLSLDYCNLLVIANVTDSRTGAMMGADDSLCIHKAKAKVTFLPISSSSYKPGLTYTAHLSVTKHDDSLLANPSSIMVSFNVTMFVPRSTTTTSTTTPPPTPPPPPGSVSPVPLKPEIMPGFPMPPFWQPDMEVVLLEKTMPLPANGFIALDVDVPPEANRISIKAEAMETTAYTSASRASSPSDNFLQLLMTSKDPQVGQQATFSIKTTEPLEQITYQLYAKGMKLAESDLRSSVPGGTKTFDLTIPLRAIMAPNCRVLVFYFRPDGEVVADSLSFKIDAASDNPVSVEFSAGQVKPGDKVDLTVRARDGSSVFLLGVDKSVQLLKSGNDITQDMITEELIGYDYGFHFHGFWRYMVICGWPYPSHGSDAESVFRDAKVAIITDGLVHRQTFDWRGPVMFESAPTAALGGAVQMDNSGAPGGGAKAELPVERVRKFFPETWLWDLVVVGPGDVAVETKTAPDTITTWLTSAFAIHPKFGLSVTPQAAELKTFRDVFVNLDLPYSVIRNEDVCLKAFAFNYYTEPLTITLTMGQTDGIANIHTTRRFVPRQGIQYQEVKIPKEISHPVGRVLPDEVGETSFCFTPTKLGRLPIRVNLTNNRIPGDGVERMLLVEPEGVPKVQATAVILDVEPGRPFSSSVPVSFPRDTVPGSQRITVSMAGDLLGPVFENIDDLLRMPYGCGEQNMLNFAPNTFLIKYLQTTNTSTPERTEKARNYMLIGYQKEIKYQHTDGSYSAFGMSKPEDVGSMWLSAFVNKCFVQAMGLKDDVVTIDPDILARSILWMISKQSPDGAFKEPPGGKVFNKNMQGGSAKGEALTAYVLIALSELAAMRAQDPARFDAVLTPENWTALETAVSLARANLEKALNVLEDSYDLAIVTYALDMSDSLLADRAFGKLMLKAIREPLTVHWERVDPNPQPRYYSWQRTTDAINIEASAYALLSTMKRNDVANALPIVRWLTSQRGDRGGFISTQDTVIGLQALSEVAAAIYSNNNPPISVTVQWAGAAPQTVTIDETTKLLLQQIPVTWPENGVIPSEIAISASTAGKYSGIAVAEVALYYNFMEKPSLRRKRAAALNTFRLTPEVEQRERDKFVLRLTASRVDGENGGMTNIEVAIPTGFAVDTDDSRYDVSGSKLAEVKGRYFILYYEEMTSTPVRAVLPMTVVSGEPINLERNPIKIYDYYEPAGDKYLETFYKLPMTAATSLCDAKPDYEMCRQVNRYKRWQRWLQVLRQRRRNPWGRNFF